MSLRTWRRRHAPALAEPVGPAPGLDPPPPAPAATPAEPAAALAPAPDELLARADEVARARGAMAAVRELHDDIRAADDPVVDAKVVHLRHRAFAELPATAGRAEWPPVVEDRFAGVEGCPEVDLADLDAAALTSAVTHHGCLLVRGLVDPGDATRLHDAIDTAFRAADEGGIGPAGAWPRTWYEPFQPEPGYPGPKAGHRGWVRAAGGVLAADSPPAFELMVDTFERAGLREVIGGYLGEPPILSVDKCTLRRVPLDLDKAEWHQDGSFLGEGIRTLNVWLALSPCGGQRPTAGLDLVPRRFEEIVPTGTPGAWFDWSVSPLVVEEVAQGAPILRPEFEPGDALLFDHLFLHRTGFPDGVEVTEERYAIESWFFAGSCYPGDSVPIVF